MRRALVWVRTDLRLDDHPALLAALEAGYAPVLVHVQAPEEEGAWAPGAASEAWRRRSLQALDAALRARGSGLVLRTGPSLPTLLALAREADAEAVFWHRRYEPACIARDTAVKQGLREAGLRAESLNGALLCEPWTIQTGQGEPYRVFTPYWRNLRARLEAAPPAPREAPATLPALPPALDAGPLDDAALERAWPAPRPAWDAGFWQRFTPGEAGALEALEVFLEGAAAGYAEGRDLPDRAGTSRLSPHLHFGEISPARCLQRAWAWAAAHPKAAAGVEAFARELGWREFSHHLLFHFPHTADENLNPRFARFDWAEPTPALLQAWQRGRTGIPIVDAGMRELWATGWMHNRVRMVVASLLTKHLRMHWLHGARWFWDTLVDADLAQNTQGWQWTAGTGADAAPYFRIFNPASQAEKFDGAGRYVRQWCPELARMPDKALYAPWEHPELLRRLAPAWPLRPIVDLKAGREAALDALQRSKA